MTAPPFLDDGGLSCFATLPDVRPGAIAHPTGESSFLVLDSGYARIPAAEPVTSGPPIGRDPPLLFGHYAQARWRRIPSGRHPSVKNPRRDHVTHAARTVCCPIIAGQNA